jgi:beta-galactosidase
LRWCDGSYIEDQDKWWLSGIYREVYILKKPKSFISDFEFTCDIENHSENSNNIDREVIANININVTTEHDFK